MKRIATIALMCLLCATMSAQQHLCFRNVQIAGRYPAFIEKMRGAGFTHVPAQSSKDFNAFKGKVEGFDGCKVVAYHTRNTKTVVKVEANLPSSGDWTALKADYDRIVAEYTGKNGQPEIAIGEFASPYSEGDGAEFKALATRKAMFETRYHTDCGAIDIVVVPDSESAAHIMIVFADAMGETQWLSENDDDDE